MQSTIPTARRQMDLTLAEGDDFSCRIMPTASARQLLLPFDTPLTEDVVEIVRAPQPAAEWRTFGRSGPVRQWIAFPPFEREIPNVTRHVRRALLVQFTDAGIWMFRIPPGQASPVADWEGVAAICRRFLGSPSPNLGTLHRQLAERIDATFEVLLPVLDMDQLAAWPVRDLAVDQVMARAMRATGQSHRRAAGTGLAQQAEALEAQMSAELRAALQGFLGHLGADGVEALRTSGKLSTQAFNFLIGPSAEVKRNRLQFTRTFPLFADALLLGNASQAYVVGLREAVDRGQPMVDFLARAFHVQRHTIRFLVRKSAEEMGPRWCGSPARLIGLLDSLPPELRPGDAESWRVITGLAAAAEERTLRPVSRALVRIAMQHVRQRIREGEVGSDEFQTAFAEQTVLVTDFWAMLEDCLRTRAATTHRSVQGISRRTLRAIADGAIAERAWTRLVALARDWGNALARAQAAVEPDRERLLGQRFSPLLPRNFLIEKRLVVPLTTSQELRREGEVLEHCIGTYTSACASGKSHIVSLRELHSGTPMSTAEFQLGRDRPGLVRLTLRQHRGYGNAIPVAECTDAIDRLLTLSDTPDLQKHWTAVIAEREARRGYAPSAARRIAAILAHEHALREVLHPRGRYERLLEQLILPIDDVPL